MGDMHDCKVLWADQIETCQSSPHSGWTSIVCGTSGEVAGCHGFPPRTNKGQIAVRTLEKLEYELLLLAISNRRVRGRASQSVPMVDG